MGETARKAKGKSTNKFTNGTSSKLKLRSEVRMYEGSSRIIITYEATMVFVNQRTHMSRLLERFQHNAVKNSHRGTLGKTGEKRPRGIQD